MKAANWLIRPGRQRRRMTIPSAQEQWSAFSVWRKRSCRRHLAPRALSPACIPMPTARSIPPASYPRQIRPVALPRTTLLMLAMIVSAAHNGISSGVQTLSTPPYPYKATSVNTMKAPLNPALTVSENLSSDSAVRLRYPVAQIALPGVPHVLLMVDHKT